MSTHPILLRGARVIDPSQGVDDIRDLLLAEGTITGSDREIAPPEGTEIIDVAGLVVSPGLIDVHVHLREPGGEHKETIATGALAAAAGGFTAICAMPNTSPPIDDPAAVGFVLAAGLRAGTARVYPVGTISVGMKGERLSEIGELVEAGAVAITDDGRPITDDGLMRLALEYARTFDIPVANHCEVLSLSRGGSMNEGSVSSRLGLAGIPGIAEDVMVARDLILAEYTGGRIHLQHISTRRSVELIREAKARGVHVTAEATPHHFTLTEEAVEGYNTNAKMNPPLRTADDRDAVREGVADATLDTIATDHAPHHYDEKEQAFADAPFGIVGLETALGLAITELVDGNLISLSQLVERMSCAPARAFSLPGGTLRAGTPADITIFDPAATWTVDPARFHSRSRNTPFAGYTLRGQPVHTIVGGRMVWSREGSR
jgi:dihydroorotase